MNAPTKILIVSVVIVLLGVGVWYGMERVKDRAVSRPEVSIPSLGKSISPEQLVWEHEGKIDVTVSIEEKNGRSAADYYVSYVTQQNTPYDFSMPTVTKVNGQSALTFTSSVDFIVRHTVFLRGEYLIDVMLVDAEPKVFDQNGVVNEEEQRRLRTEKQARFAEALRTITIH